MTSTLANSLITDDLYLNQALLPALEQIELYLQDFANSEEFVAKMRLAFGETFDPEAALNLGNAWKNQDFSNIPAITILSSSELNGQMELLRLLRIQFIYHKSLLQIIKTISQVSPVSF